MHFNGYAVDQDFEKAIQFFAPSSDSGLGLASLRLGLMYHQVNVVLTNIFDNF